MPTGRAAASDEIQQSGSRRKADAAPYTGTLDQVGVVGIVFGVAVILLIAYALGAGGGPFGRFFGRSVRAGRIGGPLGDQPDDPDRQFDKPRNENELL
jgi:hypothetical protein